MEPTSQAAAAYKVNLPAYDGPLDLLLDLIRKQEMNIHDIPIAKITGQYLDYLRKLEELDVDVSADFIYMAATLILIKSKMLLPPDPFAAAEEQGDPRAELVHRLGEHEKFKMRRICCTRSSNYFSTCGRSRTCRYTTPRAPKRSWWFRWWIW